MASLLGATLSHIAESRRFGQVTFLDHWATLQQELVHGLLFQTTFEQLHEVSCQSISLRSAETNQFASEVMLKLLREID